LTGSNPDLAIGVPHHMTDVPGAIGSTDKPPFARGTLSYTEGFNRLERQQTVAPSGGDLERLALSSPFTGDPCLHLTSVLDH